MYRLRELERSDLVEINRWRNDPELIAQLGAPFRYINLGTDEAWFNYYQDHRNEAVRCVVTDETGQIYGLISLIQINTLQQSAVLHVMIGPKDMRNKGIGSFMVSEMLKHAFLNLNLHRVELSVLSGNSRARHLYEKLGFSLEGCKRKAVYKNGAFSDLCLYGILKEEYLLHTAT